MKTKKISFLDIDLGKALEFAENGISEFWQASETQLNHLLRNKPKSKGQRYLDKKGQKRKKELKVIAKEQDYRLEMTSTIIKNQTDIMTERLSELESQGQETSQELSR